MAEGSEPFDQAIKDYWDEAKKKVVGHKQELTQVEAFLIMQNFFEIYSKKVSSPDDLQKLLIKLKESCHSPLLNKEMSEEWNAAIKGVSEWEYDCLY